jgi:hypothetical protein
MRSKQEIRHQCRELLPLLEKSLGEIEQTLSALPDNFVLEVSIKPFVRLFAKMQEREMQDPQELSDLIRGRLYFPSESNHRKTVDLLTKLLGSKIKGIDYKNQGDNQEGTYPGVIHVDLNLNGINFELQVLPIEFRGSIEIFHNLYELIRDKGKMPEKLRKKLTDIHDQLGKHLMQDARHERQAGFLEYPLAAYGGVLEPPPGMISAGVNFVVGAAAQHLLDRWKAWSRGLPEPDPYLKGQIENKKQILMGSIARARPFANLTDGAEKMIPFDFAGWKSPYGDPMIVQRIMEASAEDGVSIKVEFVGREDVKAHWLSDQWKMQVYLGLPKIGDGGDFVLAADWLLREEGDIRLTIEHELIHMVQNIGMIIKNIKGVNWSGLPPQKVRHPDYDPLGYQREDPGHRGTSRSHELRDVEFYTNLHNAIKEFQRLSSKLPEELRDQFLRVFMGDAERVDNPKDFSINLRDKLTIHPFFAALKRYDLRRWKLAVKRMIAYLDQNGGAELSKQKEAI